MGENIDGMIELLTSIFTEGIIIIIVCYAVAEIIKRSTLPFFKKMNRGYIPIILIIIGISLSFIPEIFPNDTVQMSMIKGFICAAASTGIFEGYKGVKKAVQSSSKSESSE